MGITRWQPFGEMQSFRNMMDRLFDEGWGRPWRTFDPFSTMGSLPLDVYEEADKYVVEATLPGVRPQDVDVQVQGNTITITGHVGDTQQGSQQQGQPQSQGQGQSQQPGQPQQNRNYLMRERIGGQFSRSVTLPAEIDADRAEASFEHGVLRLTLPKTPANQPKHIQIQGVQGSQPAQIGSGGQQKAA